MRNLIYGIVFGAAAMYFYTYHSHQLVWMKGRLDTWRDQAVTDTKGYSTSPKQK